MFKKKGLGPKDVYEKKGELNLLDVREDDEWEAGHVEGSIHIPMQQIPARLGEIDKDKPLVAVCRSGGRSAQVVSFLRQQGYEIDNLDGGLKSWQKEGLPLVSSNGSGQVV